MRILITGGTGSLGRALVRYYLRETEHRVIVYSRDELKQAEMRAELPSGRLDFHLGDVRDLPRLRLSFDAGLDVVIHAAALKRVDATANNPDELLKTNILGSRNVLHAARGIVPYVLLVSSDKACYPTNPYGRSKAVAEDLFRSFNVYSGPRGTVSGIVRYGNVLGSRGSVARLWAQAAAEGAVLRLTDERMTRFVLTLDQAVGYLQDAIAARSRILIPSALPSMRLVDLAEAIAPGRTLEITGLRPGGEKLHETLVTDEEAVEWDTSPLRSDRNLGYCDLPDLRALLKEEGIC